MAEFGPGSSKIVRSDENVLITEVTRFDGSVDTYSQTVYYDGEGGSSHNPPVLMTTTPAVPRAGAAFGPVAEAVRRGGGGGGGGGGASAVPPPPSFKAPRPAGAGAPGQRVFQEADFEKMYATWIDKGQKLIQQLADPNFLNMTAAAMAMKFEPPPGWEQLLRGGTTGGGAAGGAAPAPFDPRTISNPFRLLLQQQTNALPNPGTLSGTRAQQGFISNIPPQMAGG